MGTVPRFHAVALTVRRLSAMSSARLLKFALRWTITLCGTFLLMTDVGTAVTPLWRNTLDAIRGATACLTACLMA
ncbi:hypothetical protein DLM46_12490 [Paraburkholderia lacunae]|uniref:Uncharacterized protein n=1 Tax=Paraburkholderia lacunae TaxID=2211104 RepID=A0A370NAD0_9BURK|nr:hypothetical protein DLM46_12490 [Paraburkholderia lacunae]